MIRVKAMTAQQALLDVKHGPVACVQGRQFAIGQRARIGDTVDVHVIGGHEDADDKAALGVVVVSQRLTQGVIAALDFEQRLVRLQFARIEHDAIRRR